MRKILLLLPIIITGCATQLPPMPAPAPKCINVPGEGCQKISAGNVGGTTIGHSDEIQDIPAKAAAVPR